MAGQPLEVVVEGLAVQRGLVARSLAAQPGQQIRLSLRSKLVAVGARRHRYDIRTHEYAARYGWIEAGDHLERLGVEAIQHRAGGRKNVRWRRFMVSHAGRLSSEARPLVARCGRRR